MPKLVPIKSRKLIKMVKKLGFVMRDAQGSHQFFAHKDGRTTVIPERKREISKGLLKKILYDIDISGEEYEKLRRKV